MQVVFYSWKVDTMSGIRRRKIPVSVVVKWFLRLGSIVFSAWRSRIRFEMECHQKMADVLHRLVIWSLFLSFDYWHFQAYQLGHQRKFSTHMVQIWTQLTLLEAFRSWMDNVKHKNQVGVIGGKVALRLLNFTTATVFDRWHDIAFQQTRKKSVLTRLVLQWRDRQQYWALKGWYARHVHARSLKLTAGRIVQRMLQKGAWASFQAWREEACGFESKRERRVFRQFLLRCKSQTVSWTFIGYRDHVVRLQVLRHMKVFHTTVCEDDFKKTQDEIIGGVWKMVLSGQWAHTAAAHCKKNAISHAQFEAGHDAWFMAYSSQMCGQDTHRLH